MLKLNGFAFMGFNNLYCIVYIKRSCQQKYNHVFLKLHIPLFCSTKYVFGQHNSFLDYVLWKLNISLVGLGGEWHVAGPDIGKFGPNIYFGKENRNMNPLIFAYCLSTERISCISAKLKWNCNFTVDTTFSPSKLDDIDWERCSRLSISSFGHEM